jgi:hypothetical protein
MSTGIGSLLKIFDNFYSKLSSGIILHSREGKGQYDLQYRLRVTIHFFLASNRTILFTRVCFQFLRVQ